MEKEADFIKKALERFKTAQEAEDETRKRGKQVDDFSINLEQWTDGARKARGEGNQSTLVLDQTNKFLRSVTNEMRMNKPQIKISPSDDDSVDTAQALEDKIRNIQVDSQADVAYETAFDSQTRKGFGYFRILTKYIDENSFEQEIRIAPIRNAYSVLLDPDRSDPDYPYPKWGFLSVDLTEERYKELYPDSELANIGLDMVNNDVPDWMSKGSKSVRIAEYWVVDEEEITLYKLATGETVEQLLEGMVPALDKVGKPLSRKSCRYKVTCYKINGIEVLEVNEWAGKYIPIIEVVGDDHDVNGKRVLTGMVWPMMDEQRQFNYWSSAATDAIALAPKAPWVMANGQQRGYEAMWAQSNSKNFPYLLYNVTTVDGVTAPPPQRQQAEPPIQAMLAMVSQAGNNMKGTSGIFDANLGQRSNETSGKAILARKHEGDVATYHYIDNFSRALWFAGVQLLDLIQKIMDTPRTERVTAEDGSHRVIKINQPYQEGNEIVHHEFTKGKYTVVVSTGPSYQTKRQEFVDSAMQMAQSYPPIMQIAGDKIVRNMDWPGAEDIAERMKKMLPPQLQEEEGQVPPQVKAQLDQAHMMIDQLTKALNDAQDKIDQKTLDLSSKERIAEQNNDVKLTIAAMQSEMANNIALFKEELAHIRSQTSAQQAMYQAQSAPQQQELPQQGA